jgi:glycosyltransferase involved in cell wall biosynthesis
MAGGKLAINISPWATFWSMGTGKGTPMGLISVRAMIESDLEVVYLSPMRGQDRGTPFPGFRGVPFACPPLLGYEFTRREGRFRRIRTLAVRLLRYLDFARRAYRLGRSTGLKGSPALVYAHGTLSALPAWLLARRFDVPWVLRLYGVTTHSLLGRTIRLAYAFEESISFRFPFTKVVIADDGSCGDVVATRSGVDPARIHLIRDGVDPEILEGLHVDRGPLRETLGYPEGHRIVLSVSRLGFPRNVDLILRAFQRVVAGDPDHTLIVLGDGRQRSELEALARELRIEDRVRFEGAVERARVYEHMQAADVLVSASHVSNLCNSTLEALALGMPVVTFDAACTRSVFRDKENGLLVPFGDVDALSDAILRVTRDPALAEHLSLGARSFAEGNFYPHEQRIGIERTLLREMIGR